MKQIPGSIVFYSFIRTLAALLLLFTGIMHSNGQAITGKLRGYFKAPADTVLYGYFAFNGNGKVDIAGWGTGDYFQTGDSVIVYPDKSIFKFLLKGNQLHGVSEWVKDNVWTLQPDTVVDSGPVDPAAADRNATLLYRYYQLKGNNEWAFLEEDNGLFTRGIKNLCDSGLARACLDYAGLKIMEDMGGAGALLMGKGVIKKRESNPEITGIIQKVIDMGDREAYAVLGAYYVSIDAAGKAREVYEKGSELGCRKCAVALFSMALEEEVQKNGDAGKTKPAGKAGSRPAPVQKKRK